MQRTTRRLHHLVTISTWIDNPCSNLNFADGHGPGASDSVCMRRAVARRRCFEVDVFRRPQPREAEFPVAGWSEGDQAIMNHVVDPIETLRTVWLKPMEGRLWKWRCRSSRCDRRIFRTLGVSCLRHQKPQSRVSQLRTASCNVACNPLSQVSDSCDVSDSGCAAIWSGNLLNGGRGELVSRTYHHMSLVMFFCSFVNCTVARMQNPLSLYDSSCVFLSSNGGSLSISAGLYARFMLLIKRVSACRCPFPVIPAGRARPHHKTS